MIIQCPTCGQAYDTTGYPENYKFACSCGTVIDVTFLMQQADAASTMQTRPPSAELAMSSSSWAEVPVEGEPGESTAVSRVPEPPPGYEPEDPLDHTLAPPPGADLDLFVSHNDDYAAEGESTAVTRSPYHNAPNPDIPPTLQEPISGVATSYDPSRTAESYAPERTSAPPVSDVVAPSWDALPDENDASYDENDAAFDGEKTLEPRAVWAMFFAILIVTGPLAWLLGWRGRSHIRLAPGIIRGKGLATFAMLLGMLETFAMGGLLYVAITQPTIHPVVTNLGRILGTVKPQTTVDSFAKRSQDPAQLAEPKAKKLVLDYWKHLDPKRKVTLPGFYLYQKSNQAHAHGYWYDSRLKKTRQAIFIRSNRGHWHLAEVGIVYTEEARVSEAGSKQLSATMAKKLIQQFWILRGRFRRVHVHKLYVVQKPGSTTAVAYWALHKQLSSQSIKTWKIRSHFRYSSAGKWHLCQYASPVPEDEVHDYATTASRRLEAEPVKTLLKQYFKEELQKRFYSRTIAIYQEPKGLEAWVYWQRGRKPPQRSLFRYANDQKWYLARMNVPPAIQLRLRTKGSKELTRDLMETLLKKYMRKSRKRVEIQHAMWLQKKPNSALVRWQLAGAPAQLGTQGAPTKPRQSRFTYAHDGQWYFTDLNYGNPEQVLYHQKGPKQLVSSIAKTLIRRYWKDQSWRSDSRRFSGAKIQTLYIYQEPGTSHAHAHWVINNNDQLTAMRSSFVRSSEGQWYLTDYDLGRGYLYKHHKLAEPTMTVKTVFAMLKAYWKAKDKDNKTTFRDVYVYQPKGSHKAYVHAVWSVGKKARPVYSLFHRSNQNRWYLSVAELPQPPHPN